MKYYKYLTKNQIFNVNPDMVQTAKTLRHCHHRKSKKDLEHVKFPVAKNDPTFFTDKKTAILTKIAIFSIYISREATMKTPHSHHVTFSK